MEISGRLVQTLPTQTGQGKNGEWKKCNFVIETGDKFSKKYVLGYRKPDEAAGVPAPNAGHGFGNGRYFMKKRWDYFVRHLKGQKPPEFVFGGNVK